jgi:INO80 complex subunit D
VHEDSPELEEDMHMVDHVLGLNESDTLEQVLETQASHLLEETDINTVLSTIQVDEFSDFFTVNRNGEYEPSREEAEELEKALAAVDNDVKSLEKLSQSQGLLDSLLDEHTLAESLVQIPDVFHNGYTPCGDSMVAQTSSFLLPVEPQSHS